MNLQDEPRGSVEKEFQMAEIGIYEAMSTLRAVRRLRPDAIPDEVLHRVLEAATWAPTGGNRQPWRIIVVKDAARKEQLGELYAGQWSTFSARYRANLAALEPTARQRMERMLGAGEYLSAHFGQSPVIAIFCFNPAEMAITDANLGRISVVGGGSVYPAVENLLLACRAEGLGCVLTTLLCACEPEVAALLAIPAPWGTAAAIPIGYPMLRGHGPITRRPVKELAFLDTWGKPV
jgi:nitroreductase